ncbi:MAG: iron-containing alcohol dehydrogenase [candidate division WOR-3 bacterium]
MVRVWPETVELGYGALKRLKDIALSVGKSPFVLSGPGRSKEICERFAKPSFIVSESTRRIVQEAKNLLSSFDSIVAIGGGKAVDVGKMVSDETGLPLVSAPTVLSGDGIASPIAVIDGTSHKVSVPVALVCDLEVISDAPKRHNSAGAGDLLSNISSAWDWRRAHELGKDNDFNGLAAAMSEMGALALLSEEPELMCSDTLRTLCEGLLLSGAAMALAGSSKPSSGSEHKISHAIDKLFGGRGLHGEQVALASVFTTYLQANSHREAMLSFFQKLGLPTKPEDIGLSFADFARCVDAAPSTRPDRFTILEEMAPSGTQLVGLIKRAYLS